MLRAKPTVEALKRYSAPLEGRRGKLRLDFNEAPLGPSPKVLEAIRALGPEYYAAYPEYDGLNQAFATSVGVKADQVACFGGVDAAIRAVFDSFGTAGSTFLTTSPTFGYYAPCASLQGMRICTVPYEEDLSFPLSAMRTALADKPRICFICNPNNPTGTQLPAENLLALAQSAPDTLVVVDELYADFSGVTVLPSCLQLQNVLVLRSLSKSRGLAGLRIGFALGNADLVDRVARVSGPYDINSFAVVAAQSSLADDVHLNAAIAAVNESRRYVCATLNSLGVRFFAGRGNYLLVWPKQTLSEVVARLDKEFGILVRSMEGKELIGGAFRLTLGKKTDMIRFLSAFQQVERLNVS